MLHRLVPVSEHLPGYRGGTLRRDLLAGLTLAALALPAAMAYAELAGLSPVAGLYALLLPTVAYTLLGSSRQLIVGPEGTIAALVATALAPLAAGDEGRYASLAALLALLVGGVFVAARLVRLGWVADYFSRAVLVGYLHGVAVVLIVGQLGKLLGLDITAQDPPAQLPEVARELGELSGSTLTVGLLCLAALLLLRWRLPKIPGPLVVVVLAIAASAALGLESKGVAVVDDIPAGLPRLELPDLRLADVRVHPRARVAPGVLVYRLDDRLVFANASYVKGRVREALHGTPTPVRWLVFDAEALTHVDATGVDALTELIRSLGGEQVTFAFARLKAPMRRALGEAGVLDLVGEQHLYPTVRAAVAAADAREEQP